MVYGYVAIDSYIYNDWDTDYKDIAVAKVKKVFKTTNFSFTLI